MNPDTQQHLAAARSFIERANGNAALRFVRLAKLALERAEKNLVAEIEGDRGGFPAEVDINKATYRVIRFEEQPSEERRKLGHLGAVVLENRGTLYVCPVIRGADGEAMLKPDSVRRIP